MKCRNKVEHQKTNQKEKAKITSQDPFIMDDKTVITELNGVRILGTDFRRFQCGKEFNDSIIDFYYKLIQNRAEKNSATMPSVYAFSTYWWPIVSSQPFDKHIAGWTKKVDLSDFDILLFPINRNNHWSLVVVDQRVKVIEYFDPLKFQDCGATTVVRDYLVDERLYYTRNLISKTDWRIITFDKFHRQNNSTDCGVYICAFAKYRTNGFTMQPAEIIDFRTKMIDEVCEGRILF